MPHNLRSNKYHDDKTMNNMDYHDTLYLDSESDSSSMTKYGNLKGFIIMMKRMMKLTE